MRGRTRSLHELAEALGVMGAFVAFGLGWAVLEGELLSLMEPQTKHPYSPSMSLQAAEKNHWHTARTTGGGSQGWVELDSAKLYLDQGERDRDTEAGEGLGESGKRR